MIRNIYRFLLATIQLLVGFLLFFIIIVNFLLSLSKIAIIKLFYALYYGKPFNILWGQDAFLQHQEHTVFTPQDSTSKILFIITFRGQPNINEWRKRFTECILNAPDTEICAKIFKNAKKRIVRKCGYYIWEEDENFVLENHIKLHAESYDDIQSLNKIAQKVFNEPFPKARPPWNIFLIRRNQSITINAELEHNSSHEYALLMVLNHSVADGAVVQLACAALSDPETKMRFEELIKFHTAHPERSSPLIKHNPVYHHLATQKNTLRTIRQIYSIIINVCQIIMAFPHLVTDLALHQDTNSLHGPLLCGRKILGVSENLDIHLLKDIGKKYNCTVNDILASCLAMAIKREDPQAKVIRIILAFGGIPPGTAGTQNSVVAAPFDIDLTKTTTIEHLKHVSGVLTDLKKSPILLATFLAVFLTANHLPHFIEKFYHQMFDATVAYTNVTGTTFPVSVDGKFATDCILYVLNFCARGAISFGCHSYLDSLRIGIVVDRAVAPDDNIADRLLGYVVEEVKQLQATL